MQPSGDRHDLEHALHKHLGRTPAPAELWDRVENARHPRQPAGEPPLWRAWAAAAAAVAVTVGGWTVWRQLSQPPTVEAMAVEALARGSERLAFRSTEASDIRTWLRDNAGLDIPLPPRHSPLIEIVGANVLDQSGVPVAEIAYRVGDRNAALLVARDPSGVRTYPRHDVRPSESRDEARVSSWSMRGQSYTLAWAAPGEFRVACLLCHGNEPPVLP